MAVVAPSSPETLDPKPDQSETLENRESAPYDASLLPSVSTPPAATAASSAPETPNPNPNPNPTVVTPPPPPAAPSFRPVGVPQMLQYSSFQNPNMQNSAFQPHMAQNPSLQPPGVAPPVSFTFPGAASGAGAVTVSVSPVLPPGTYYSAPGQAPPRPYWQTPNGYMPIPAASPQGQGMIPPPASAFASW